MGRWPVSVKGVLLRDDHVVLLWNERDEWELPGGKLELEESPAECVQREFSEELGLSVEAAAVVDAWVYPVLPEASVLIVTYGCTEGAPGEIRLTSDHPAFGWFELSELDGLPLPEGYRRSIRAWAEQSRWRDAFVV